MAHKSFNNVALAQRIPLTFSTAQAQGKPTTVAVGCNSGFSMPVYNSDDEEIFFTLHIPRRWDGTTDPVISVKANLGNTEDVGDKLGVDFN